VFDFNDVILFVFVARVIKIVVVSVLTASSSLTRVEPMSDRAMSAAVKVSYIFTLLYLFLKHCVII